MRIRFDNPTPIKEVTKLKGSITPRYGKKGSTGRGEVHCTCGICVGYMLFFTKDNKDGLVVGWLDTDCHYCNKEIDFSEAVENL